MKHEKRSKWSSQATFILAAIGSAVGLGNAWRFPGLAAKHGGGTFLLIYLVALFVVGIPLLMMEVSVARKFHRGAGGNIKHIIMGTSDNGQEVLRQNLEEKGTFQALYQMHLLFLPIMQLFSHG